MNDNDPHKSKIESFDEDMPVSIGGDTPGDIFDVWVAAIIGVMGLYGMMLGHPIYGSIVVGIAITYVGKLFVWDIWLANYYERIRIKWTSQQTKSSNPQPTPTSPKSSDGSQPTPSDNPSTPISSPNSSG